MCGIVGAVAQRDVTPILLEGLRRLEYRGYDSAGMAVLDGTGKGGISTTRTAGKVAELADSLAQKPLSGKTGIAHTRWATHGSPSVDNAHPHVCRDEVAIVHNGIIENHNRIRTLQQANGYRFCSQTDSEVVVNEIHRFLSGGADPLQSVFYALKELEGAYALGIIFRDQPDRLIAARNGSPLVIGIGIAEYFIASDILALLPVTRRFIYLEDGDIADIDLRNGVRILDQNGREVQRPVVTSASGYDGADKCGYPHYMLKEIYSQPAAITEALEGRIVSGKVLDESFGFAAAKVLDRARAVQIVACGTSYHAGLVAKYWFESIAGTLLLCRIPSLSASPSPARRPIPWLP